mmetsp:Transcript_19311/g.49112  ORF Transcript_19311/g.49112 Transcript_19311/m.49112 type:complete len:464 (-) Transcript_19311:310-1701(-)
MPETVPASAGRAWLTMSAATDVRTSDAPAETTTRARTSARMCDTAPHAGSARAATRSPTQPVARRSRPPARSSFGSTKMSTKTLMAAARVITYPMSFGRIPSDSDAKVGKVLCTVRTAHSERRRTRQSARSAGTSFKTVTIVRADVTSSAPAPLGGGSPASSATRRAAARFAVPRGSVPRASRAFKKRCSREFLNSPAEMSPSAEVYCVIDAFQTDSSWLSSAGEVARVEGVLGAPSEVEAEVFKCWAISFWRQPRTTSAPMAVAAATGRSAPEVAHSGAVRFANSGATPDRSAVLSACARAAESKIRMAGKKEFWNSRIARTVGTVSGTNNVTISCANRNRQTARIGGHIGETAADRIPPKAGPMMNPIPPEAASLPSACARPATVLQSVTTARVTATLCFVKPIGSRLASKHHSCNRNPTEIERREYPKMPPASEACSTGRLPIRSDRPPKKLAPITCESP